MGSTKSTMMRTSTFIFFLLAVICFSDASSVSRENRNGWSHRHGRGAQGFNPGNNQGYNGGSNNGGYNGGSNNGGYNGGYNGGSNNGGYNGGYNGERYNGGSNNQGYNGGS